MQVLPNNFNISCIDSNGFQRLGQRFPLPDPKGSFSLEIVSDAIQDLNKRTSNSPYGRSLEYLEWPEMVATINSTITS